MYMHGICVLKFKRSHQNRVDSLKFYMKLGAMAEIARIGCN